jgi:hypothetical protein
MAEKIDRMPRRKVIQLGVAAAATSLLPAWMFRRDIANAAGKFADELVDPERIMQGPLPVLVPRENDIPVVSPRPKLAVPKVLTPQYTRRDGNVFLQLNEGSLQSEHTGAALVAGALQEAGTGIITSAEGPQYGKQEYCRFFRGEEKDQLIAVGFEKGLYTYDTGLKEWVRITTNEGVEVHSSGSWQELEEMIPKRMLLEDVNLGINTLRSVGYRPWACILPSTRIPDGTTRPLAIEDYAQNIDEVLESEKKYFVTQNGDMIDIGHLRSKAQETLLLIAQLYYQHLSQEKLPTAKVAYNTGNSANFEFVVSPNSLHPEIIFDTTFQLMTQVSYLMEGISQRYLLEKIPELDFEFLKNGMNPEDMFSNSLGIVTALKFIKDNGLLEKLREPLQTIHANYASKASPEEIIGAITGVLQSGKNQLMEQVMKEVLKQYGMQKVDHVPSNSSLGLYPLVPSKIANVHASTPTHIDLGTINPNNEAVQYLVTHVPVYQTTFQRGVKELDNLVGVE